MGVGAAFCGKSIVLSRWWNRAFRKKAIFEAFSAFFPLKGMFFVRAVLNVEEVDRREMLRNTGFRSDFASFCLFDSF